MGACCSFFEPGRRSVDDAAASRVELSPPHGMRGRLYPWPTSCGERDFSSGRGWLTRPSDGGERHRRDDRGCAGGTRRSAGPTAFAAARAPHHRPIRGDVWRFGTEEGRAERRSRDPSRTDDEGRHGYLHSHFITGEESDRAFQAVTGRGWFLCASLSTGEADARRAPSARPRRCWTSWRDARASSHIW